MSVGSLCAAFSQAEEEKKREINIEAVVNSLAVSCQKIDWYIPEAVSRMCC
jgi:hypothetical protein